MSRPPVVGGDTTITAGFRHLCCWENLMLAWRRQRAASAARRASRFEYRAEEQLSEIREQLLAGTYQPGCYVHFHIKDPKRRKISAIRFRDRVVHHALCNVIEPRFERLFIPDSYANRKGKGTHRAVDRLQGFARRHRYVLRADIVQHFASVDHAILLDILRRRIPEADVMRLVEAIVESGRGVLDDESLCALRRRRPARRLPAARPADRQSHLAVLVQLLPAPVRSVRHPRARLPHLSALRGRFRAVRRQQAPALGVEGGDHRTACRPASPDPRDPGAGVAGARRHSLARLRRPPTHCLIKARKVRSAHGRLRARLMAYHEGEISFAELDASIQGWINHVRHADSWGLRRHVLDTLVIRPAEHRTNWRAALSRRPSALSVL